HPPAPGRVGRRGVAADGVAPELLGVTGMTHTYSSTRSSLTQILIPVGLACVVLLPLRARADGPAYLVRDINTREVNALDSNGGPPPAMASFHGKAYFPVFDRQAGPGLWCSDGTTAGTVQVKDGRVGESWLYGRVMQGGLTVADDALYF